MYKKGLHILSEFKVKDTALISNYQLVASFLNESIIKNNLSKVGEVYHQFEDGGGFTAVICLTESHISIHTWPEFNVVTFDVFLSNYKKQNNEITINIHDQLLKLLSAYDITTTQLNR